MTSKEVATNLFHCSACGAEPGDSCRTYYGSKAARPHRPRMQAAGDYVREAYCENESQYGWGCGTKGCPHCGGTSDTLCRPRGDDVSRLARKDRIAATLWGVAIGDAWGGVLEFLETPPADSLIGRAGNMPGGGPHRLAPGQVTDDTELTLALASAMAGGSDPSEAYAKWYRSRPFDCGFTCQRAFSGAPMDQDSQANGALMRAAPIGALLCYEKPDVVIGAAIDDAKRSHPNPITVAANVIYSLAIHGLVRGESIGTLMDELEGEAYKHDPVVGHWFTQAKRGKPTDATEKVGWVRHGFVQAFTALQLNLDYEDGVSYAIRQGGDTDTNAAIVGGLLGAAAGGIANLPQDKLARVRNAETRKGRQRPVFYHPAIIDDLVDGLWGDCSKCNGRRRTGEWCPTCKAIV